MVIIEKNAKTYAEYVMGYSFDKKKPKETVTEALQSIRMSMLRLAGEQYEQHQRLEELEKKIK